MPPCAPNAANRLALNPCFLNAQMAIDEFVAAVLDGLGAKAGALVFQFSPLPDQMLGGSGRASSNGSRLFLARCRRYLKATCYAVESATRACSRRASSVR